MSMQSQQVQPVDDTVPRLPNVPDVQRLVGKGYDTPLGHVAAHLC